MSDAKDVKDEKSAMGQNGASPNGGAEHEQHERAATPSPSDEGHTVVGGNDSDREGQQLAPVPSNFSEKKVKRRSTTLRSGKEDAGRPREDGKIIITEKDCPEKLGFAFPTWKKWCVISVIFAVQTSMNMNASIYANAVKPLSKAFSISEQAARVGEATFLIAYAFGSELWAPWSEELGRWPVLQASLFLVNIWALMCALAPNFGTIIVGRTLGGLSSAGGSVTLGMVADMWDANHHQYAIAFIVLSSVGGSVVGPIVGPFIEANLSWRWNFWVQLIFGGAVQAMHFFLVPETRETILLTREAKRRRKAGEDDTIYGPDEVKKSRFSVKEILTVWARPFEMFVCEPIVLCLSLLSGFSDALIFTFLASFTLVFEQWGFGTEIMATTFIPIALSYIAGWLAFMPFIRHQTRIRDRDGPDALQPEVRLYGLLWFAPLETIGLFGFAWTSLGPPQVHWIAPMIFSFLIGFANYAIYFTTIDYMVEAYGPFSASATGGNALARDGLAGIAAMYSTPFYSHFKTHTLEYPTTILACISFVVTIPIFLFYRYGPRIRAKSKFAQVLASDRKAKGDMGGTGDVSEKAKSGHPQEV